MGRESKKEEKKTRTFGMFYGKSIAEEKLPNRYRKTNNISLLDAFGEKAHSHTFEAGRATYVRLLAGGVSSSSSMTTAARDVGVVIISSRLHWEDDACLFLLHSPFSYSFQTYGGDSNNNNKKERERQRKKWNAHYICHKHTDAISLIRTFWSYRCIHFLDYQNFAMISLGPHKHITNVSVCRLACTLVRFLLHFLFLMLYYFMRKSAVRRLSICLCFDALFINPVIAQLLIYFRFSV